MQYFLDTLDFWQIISAFIFLIAIIDPVGNIPVTISMEKNGAKIHPFRVCVYSFVILCAFLLLGDIVMKVFGVKPEYFAIAGGFVIFLMALEMLLDIVIFKSTDLGSNGDLVPLAFPLYAGPGAFTAMLSLTTDYQMINLLIAIGICMIFLYGVLTGTHYFTDKIRPATFYIIRKFFGVVVLAIAVQLMFGNLVKVFNPSEEHVAPILSVHTVDAVSGNTAMPEF